MIFGSFASCVKYPHLPGKILQTVVQTVDRKSWLEWISIKGNDMQRIFEFAIVETWSFSWISSSAWWDALLAAYQCFRSCHISQFWRCVHKYLAKWVPPFQIFNWPILTLREYANEVLYFGKEYLTMALTDFTGGSDILAADGRPK